MEYYPVLSEKLCRLNNKHDIRPAIKSKYNIYSFLPKTYNSGNTKYLSGVYQISCNNCNSVYVGQTRSGFNQRFTQHERAIANNKPESSNFAKHIIETGHDPNVTYNNNCKVLAIEDNFIKRNFLEGCYIQKAVKSSDVTCVNAIINPYYSSLVSYALQLEK
jgi:GIY-YIG catalytic domain